MTYQSIALLFLMISTNICFAQEATTKVDFSSDKWKTFGAVEVKEFDSKLSTCILDGTGIAYLDGIDFQNGIIECDLYSPSPKAYLGIVFRVGSLYNFEYIYFQPHTSGKWDAVQYDPIFNRSATWQLYNGKEHQAAANIPTKKWFHVKIEVADDLAKVYLDYNPKPVLSVKLKHEYITGAVGVCSYHPAIFANLKITKHAPVSILQTRPLPTLDDKTYISNWLVSEPYDNFDFAIEKAFLKEAFITKWHQIGAEENYLINLNRYFTKSASKNTVLAKTMLISEKAQTKTLHFGYSDKIKIYLNSKELFKGDNRFNDTGKYDDRGYVLDQHKSIELPLLKGKNDLIIEVAEDKFGWGFIAKLEDLEGIEIRNLKQ
ncbi:hypothetical protein [Marinifilum caeruleilacunae]|uniref:DUF1080 domain-containing protein n=1 Tax=Marinifilum caeruleilacunae TaxID=2499076 RepID=A0ABX1WQX6_9BACT|nr:hypothetical protein [Marinifilum caeruleilacunae]NOU58495.1 hypothetical protein [Marinifilum caeruleilacunae]